jgi:hypothetical protein
MATLPKAKTSVQDTAGAIAGGLDTICTLAPSPLNADMVPRLFGAAKDIYDFHGYSEGVEYASFHAQEVKQPILYVAMPIETAGVVGRFNTAGNTGSSVPTVSAVAGGCLTEHDGVVKVFKGGTVGTDQIVLEISLDGGRLFKKVRLGTASSYVFPYVGAQIAFAAGTLVAGDTIITWHGTGPRCLSSDLTTARTNLAGVLKFFRSMILMGDLQSDTEAAAFRDELNAYETSDDRFVYGRAAVLDRLPYSEMSHVVARMTAGTSLTFAEVGASGDTITRATGSWISDGFAVGDTIVITLSASNNITAVIASLSALVITLGTEDLAAEVTANASIVAYPTLTFAEVGGTGDTITRNRGSWLADGFRVGDKIAVTGTASNNITATQGLTAVTALVLTLGTDDLAAEVIRTQSVTVKAGQTKAVWMASIDAEFASIDDEFRIDLAAGRGRKASPFSGWNFRRPASWAASLREYQHDLHITTWAKELGPTGWDLNDEDGNLVEWDDRVDGEAAAAARFTSFRTWSNGPEGAFISLSLTRAVDGSLLSHTSNVAVTNLACTTVQLNTEKVVGRTLVLQANGKATTDSLATVKAEVDSALSLALLSNKKGEGQRASLATWSPSPDDLYNIAEPVMNGVLTLVLNGIVHSVRTQVRVGSGA